jgi:transketolase
MPSTARRGCQIDDRHRQKFAGSQKLQDANPHESAPRIRDIRELERIARELRRQVIRLVAPTGQGYVQQGLGAADLFTALYFSEMRLDPKDPDWRDRDRFILSTAHNTAIFYAALAARGMIDPALLPSYCVDGSPLEINASERVGSVVEATCGSLGQGLSVAAGMALSARRHGRNTRVYIMLGDGELQEGQVWEAAMAAGSWRLSNLCLILDYNAMQVEGHVDKVFAMEPIADKWRAFNWNVLAIDGNEISAILDALDSARTISKRPTCIIARTLVGKGAPSLEGVFGHNLKLPADAAERALAELTEIENGQ